MESSTESKRTSLENLSKEELLQKCKALLSIAQRAKAAKDEALSEAQNLKEELASLKKEKFKDEATAEMIEALTSQKLQLTIELDKAEQTSQVAKTEYDGLRAVIADQEVQIESLRRQLCRAENDCSGLETRLERLDAENRRLASVANEAEAQLRRGAVERQDVLEGLGDELANIKNAAAEAVAERDRLKAQLQQHNPSNNFQTLESCQLLAQELRSSQSLLRFDVTELQSAAQAMAADLGQALAEAQTATEADARHRSKDLLAEMNEAMKTRGEVAAQLAQKLSDMERERDGLRVSRQEDATKIKSLEEKCNLLQQQEQQQKLLCTELKESENKLKSLMKLREEDSSQLAKLQKISKEKDAIYLELNNIKEEMKSIILQKSELEKLIEEKNTNLQQILLNLDVKNEEIMNCAKNVCQLEQKVLMLEKVEAENAKLSKNLTTLQMSRDESSATISSLQEKIFTLKNEQNSLIEEIEHLKNLPTEIEPGDLEKQIQHVQQENKNLKNDLLKMKCDNMELCENITALNEGVTDLDLLKQDNNKMVAIIADFEKQQETSEKLISDLQGNLSKFETIEEEKEKLEIQVLALQSQGTELSQALSCIESLKLELSNNEHIKEDNKKLGREIETLLSKNSELCQSINNLQGSLSAVQSLQEKENKLTKEMSVLKDKNNDLADTIASLKEKLTMFEKEREDCEGASVSTVSRSEDAGRLKDVEESFEERYTKLRAVAVKLKQKCQDQAGLLTKVLTERTELQNKLTTFSKERDTLAKNLQSMQAACDAATDEAEATRDKAQQSEKELKRAGEELARARNQHAEATEKAELSESKLQQALLDLEATKQERKKSSMLNLEMAAYERSAAEQDRKLAQLKEEVESLKAEVECQKSVAKEKEKESKQWEEQSKHLSSNKARLEEQLAQCKTQHSETLEELAAESQKYSDAMARFEAKRSELERVELQLAELTAEKLQNEEAAKNFRDQAARQIHILEDQVSSALATVTARENELVSLQSEFEGYKVRAQAVLLRQQQQQPQKEDRSKEAERENELILLKTTVERLQTALCDAGGRERNLQAEISVLTGQNAAVEMSARTLASHVSELNTKCEELNSKIHKNEESLRDATRQHRLALDTLSSSYKQQLAEAEKRHKAQIANLQAAQEEMAHQVLSPPTEQENPTLQQREEGEGSENVDSPKAGTSTDNRREPLSLDRLLSSSSDYPDEAKSEISLDAASVSSVVAAERRAKHLAALLGEAEADLARLTQQNAVLKEEIRRQQRCMERQQHTLSNGEYLKNVVLKFVTLQGGDERARLVPVLNTILKLSPEETQQLQTVATGAPSAASGATGSSSWGSYLHLWSGAH